MRPNPPRMVTVVLSVVLLAVGLALLYLPPAQIAGVIGGLPIPRDLARDLVELGREARVAYACLLAGPGLLVVGSLLPRI